jgi:hypothetical protein
MLSTLSQYLRDLASPGGDCCAALFLASDESGYVAGADRVVDSGLSAL